MAKGRAVFAINGLDEVVVVRRTVSRKGAVGNAALMIGGFFIAIGNGCGHAFFCAKFRAFCFADGKAVMLGIFRDTVSGGLQAHFCAGLARRDGQGFADAAEVALCGLPMLQGQRQGDWLVTRFVQGHGVFRRFAFVDARCTTDCGRRRSLRGGIVRVIRNVQGQVFFDTETALVSGFDGQADFLFIRIVKVLSGFEFQGAIGADFKARIAHGIGVAVTRVRVGSGKATYCDAIFAFGNLVVIEGNVARCVVVRGYGICLFALRGFVMCNVVRVGSTDADFVSCIVFAKGVAAARGFFDGLAIA